MTKYDKWKTDNYALTKAQLAASDEAWDLPITDIVEELQENVDFLKKFDEKLRDLYFEVKCEELEG